MTKRPELQPNFSDLKGVPTVTLAVDGLSQEEQRVVLQCMKAIQSGPYIEDWEFETRLGISRLELLRVISNYPDRIDSKDDSVTRLSINNSLNEICYGIHFPPAEWQKWFDISKEEVKRIYAKWAQLKG